MKPSFSRLNTEIVACRKCRRLTAHCQKIAKTKRKSYAEFDYWGKPVTNFGDPPARLLIVGLAPGAHGANRTGRMFTGDRSGDWLFKALFEAGFASQPDSSNRDDSLQLRDCVITAVCHCAPPDNKPSSGEIENCRPFLMETIRQVQPTVFLALGSLAWKSVVKIASESNWLKKPKPQPKFGHGAKVSLLPNVSAAKKGGLIASSERWLVGSYHPSQQNTFTGRLTEKMFHQVFTHVNRLLQTESKS